MLPFCWPPVTIGRSADGDPTQFQDIFVINLPSRTDRRDSMALAGSLTEMHFNFSDGVDGQDIRDRILPADSANKNILPGNKGSWRAHMNVLRK